MVSVISVLFFRRTTAVRRLFSLLLSLALTCCYPLLRLTLLFLLVQPAFPIFPIITLDGKLKLPGFETFDSKTSNDDKAAILARNGILEAEIGQVILFILLRSKTYLSLRLLKKNL